MNKIAWITDSTCGLSEDFIKSHDIHVLPMNVILNNISYKEDVELTKDAFYEKLSQYGDGAKTSQPAFGDFITLYEKLKENYEYGIAIHASSELTGTYQSSIQAAEMTGFKVEVIDSKIGSYPLGKMIRNGIELEHEGKSYEQIVSRIKEYPAQAEMYLLSENLDQLKKSGRVSTTAAIFANILNMNVLLGFEDGKVIVKEKIRTKKRAKRRLFQMLEEAIEYHDLREICIVHAGVKEKALQWKEELEKVHSRTKIRIETLVPVAGVHTGHGTMSVAWLKGL